MKKPLPVYHIEQFHDPVHDENFYANELTVHLKKHHFIFTPHKHDFYLVVLFTHGSGTHEVDFTTYPVKPGTVFMLKPGQTHNWKLSKNIDGFIFFHSKSFYDEGFTAEKIKSYPFFNSIHNSPALTLKGKTLENTGSLFRSIIMEFRNNEILRHNKLHCLINLVYIELARNYVPDKEIVNETYLIILAKLEELIDKFFREKKYPKEYAELMNYSEKHLNRICKSSLNKTTTDLIADRIILEAKRLMIHSSLTIAQVADELGYIDHSYFTRFFKKRTGKNPLEFRAHYSSKLGK